MLDTSQEKNALLVSGIFEIEKLIISYEKNDFLVPRNLETGKFETCLQNVNFWCQGFDSWYFLSSSN